ncbi:alpha-E domain-containing protein [Thioflexithrix psekupsensis]|uniref:DUF403 domain-containing protein n=1 Tax=Thioflexithrix psekupsensis TaxID=1570016 RepID=A0A251X9H9_9GAMM|nr:alpha-E domain-containing protein [Thioflexithrix psekupsensis]OUD14600.1 hypothetical protein TPSD3_09970 [Thioflexithrix psekupsensis]
MLSRVASNIYWMARYIERAENTARLINVNTHLLLDLPKQMTFGWQPLIAITGGEDLFYRTSQEANEYNITRFLLVDIENPSSVLSALSMARENMRTTRDIVPSGAWEQLNDLYLYVKSNVNNALNKRTRYDFLKHVIESSQLITGLIAGTMSRGDGYNFMRMGSYLERADMTTRILDVRSANLLPKLEQGEEASINLTPFDNIQWMSVLKSLSAYQMYRHHVRSRVRGPDVLHFLLQNQQFPRAFSFCLGTVEHCLNSLPKNDLPLRQLARLRRQVQGADMQKLAYTGLHEFMDELQLGLINVHSQIESVYFSSSQTSPSQTQTQTQGQVA